MIYNSLLYQFRSAVPGLGEGCNRESTVPDSLYRYIRGLVRTNDIRCTGKSATVITNYIIFKSSSGLSSLKINT